MASADRNINISIGLKNQYLHRSEISIALRSEKSMASADRNINSIIGAKYQ